MPNPAGSASARQKFETVRSGDPRDRGGKAQPLLIVNGLKKFFPVRGGIFNRALGVVRAVDDVSFVILKGETLGESGCGKSTLARLLMNLIPRTAGELIFDGDVVGEEGGISLRELRRNMQMVFQDSYSSLNPRLPVEDSIAYGPRVHGAKRPAARKVARERL
jgi:peptide/nickel transport system ATP-binding protein